MLVLGASCPHDTSRGAVGWSNVDGERVSGQWPSALPTDTFLFAVVLGPVSDYQLFSEAGHAGFSLAPLPEKDRVTGSSAGS